MAQFAAVMGGVVTAIQAALMGVLWLSGVFAGSQIATQDLAAIKAQLVSAELPTMKAQVTALSVQVQRLQDQMNGGVRVDQLTVLDRHLSAQDGRMDGIDTRMRDLDQRAAKTETRLQMMEDASRTQLNRR